MFLLQFNTGGSNSVAFTTVEKAKEKFSNLAGPEMCGMHWENPCGDCWALVPDGFVWGAQYGSAWAQKTPNAYFTHISIIPLELDPDTIIPN